jgi:hypothetical protein
MPIHDWTRVEAGVFHHFQHASIEEIKRELNAGVLPADYYAMAEQFAAGFGPGGLTLHAPHFGGNEETCGGDPGLPVDAGGTLLSVPPKARIIAETDMEFYRRKQSMVAVRHVSGDRVVAVLEVVEPVNKSTRRALEQFVKKAAEFLDRSVHLLILDLLPPGRYDRRGVHGAIWAYIADQEYSMPTDKLLTLAAYEVDLAIRAYVEPVAVGDLLPKMPLFLQPGGWIQVLLEASYQRAWDTVPRRWRNVIEARG